MRNQNYETLHPVMENVTANIEKVIIGKKNEIILCLVALLAEGHVLIEDVPGVGKTMMVRALAKSIDASFKRIQFTPDLMPSDVTGVSIYNAKEMQFEYHPGPIMANIVLADEINRTSPKTQSALLESLEEGHVTVDGESLPLPKPFMVLATQNPIEYEGTYPLPEAQLDRFLLKIKMGYPSPKDEIDMLRNVAGGHPIQDIQAVITLHEILLLRQQVKEIFIDDTIKTYIVDIANETRNHPSVYLGVSPRGSIALMKAAAAFAFIKGREYVIPDDVKFLAPFVLQHRMLLTTEANYKGITKEVVLTEILKQIHVPIHKKWRG